MGELQVIEALGPDRHSEQVQGADRPGRVRRDTVPVLRYFHAEAARLFGATEDEITETALVAKNTMGWSTYLNTLQFDYDAFTAEFDEIAAHIREEMAVGAPA